MQGTSASYSYQNTKQYSKLLKHIAHVVGVAIYTLFRFSGQLVPLHDEHVQVSRIYICHDDLLLAYLTPTLCLMLKDRHRNVTASQTTALQLYNYATL